MEERELIYKDEARRAILDHAPTFAWCINNIKPAKVEKTGQTPKTNEYWIARIKYWPAQEPKVSIVFIHYAWLNGRIQFIPFGETDPIWDCACESIEYLERIEVEKYDG